jgi:predicted small lipoprotein YifL
MRKAFLLPLLCCAACEATGPLSKPDSTVDAAERDRRQCESLMYSDRQSKGRSAPNWNLYEYCMTQRGYARGH